MPPIALSPQAADAFILQYSSTSIKGDSAKTLQNYLNTRNPPYGVVIEPYAGASYLVWYDATNHLHVIDITGDRALTASVSNADYHTADESLVYDLWDQTVNVAQRAGEVLSGTAKALANPPSLASLTTLATLGLVAYLVFAFKPSRA